MARMAAGIQLKNTLASNDPKVKVQYQQRWLAFPPDVRDYVKANVRRIMTLVLYFVYMHLNKWCLIFVYIYI